jgi:hypothetical protein
MYIIPSKTTDHPTFSNIVLCFILDIVSASKYGTYARPSLASIAHSASVKYSIVRVLFEGMNENSALNLSRAARFSLNTSFIVCIPNKRIISLHLIINNSIDYL